MRPFLVGFALFAALAGATSAAPTSTAPDASSAASAGGPTAVDSAKCVALIRNKKGKYVPVYESVYKYKFVKEKRSQTKFQRKIVKVRQNELLEYTLSNLAGLLKVFRYVEVEELSPTRCRVVNGEIMGGPLGGLVSRRLGEGVAQALKGMNEALKQVAERKWRGRPG
jgi:hypothetical protein